MKYFAIIDDKQCGPFLPQEMPAVGVRPSTYVWCKGMTDWQQAREVADICRFYRNHIYDICHPTPTPITVSDSAPAVNENIPLRFRSFIPADTDVSPLNDNEDTTQPPKTWMSLAIIATIFFFFPTGIVAIIMSHRADRLWKEGKVVESHEVARKAKMMTGFSICIGLILFALLIRFL
ncbi:MAG: DUF4339 domain-containing protein [Bacteroidales bacterium]|nr:DUF4339 domain-containing protein [Bacteroidales bacterium]